MTFDNLSLDEVLDDLSSRFLLNVPEEELVSIERICFQIEQAHWYYEDFVRQENSSLPSIPNLKQFFARFFKHCPFLHPYVKLHDQAFKDFIQYKFRVPVCGAIILNPSLSKVLLVKGWNSKTWSWPRGKINKDELELNCAVREVMEETGFDISNNLSPRQEYVEITIKEQRIRLYYVINVDEDVEFQTQTRKEIADIQWHTLTSLPGYSTNAHHHHNQNNVGGPKMRYYMLTPFFSALRAWIHAQKHQKRSILKPKVVPKVVATSKPQATIAGPPSVPKSKQVVLPFQTSQQPKTAYYTPLVSFQFNMERIHACLHAS